MIQGSDLPAINAGLNTTSAFLVFLGWLAIRGKPRRLGTHKTCMLSAFVVSTVFLASYLYYHFAVKGGKPTPFPSAQAPTAALVYYAILLSHTVLAIAAAPMVVLTVGYGLFNRLDRHVRLARWTLPVWLYVSITGVVVYVMLYRIYPPT